MFCRSLFVPFLLVIVLSVLLWFTDSDYPFGNFNLFIYLIWCTINIKRRVNKKCTSKYASEKIIINNASGYWDPKRYQKSFESNFRKYNRNLESQSKCKLAHTIFYIRYYHGMGKLLLLPVNKKKEISNSAPMTRFWNNLHRVRS